MTTPDSRNDRGTEEEQTDPDRLHRIDHAPALRVQNHRLAQVANDLLGTGPLSRQPALPDQLRRTYVPDYPEGEGEDRSGRCMPDGIVMAIFGMNCLFQ